MGVGKKGDELGSFLLKIGNGEQRKEQLNITGFCVHNIVILSKCHW